jgi:hypothetical protein
VLGVVGGIHGDALTEIEVGGGQGGVDGYLPLYHRLGVDGVEGGLQLALGKARGVIPQRDNYQPVQMQGIVARTDAFISARGKVTLLLVEPEPV